MGYITPKYFIIKQFNMYYIKDGIFKQGPYTTIWAQSMH